MDLRQDNTSLVKRALKTIDELQSQLAAVERARREPIAVIGLGCRFPGGANDAASFWRLLRDGVDAIAEVPRSRWNIDDYFDPDREAPGKMYTRQGAFLKGIEDFDAHFFRISPREAASLDPQQRLLMEVSWEALEDAGVGPMSWWGRPAGVFMGLASSDYTQLLASRDDAEIDAYLATGNAHSMAAGRISYLLGFEGPSVCVDTACSSGLSAVHLAIQSLRSGECSLALAGAANCILTPDCSINFCKSRMLAADGRCKTFDARADGFVRGEGAGVVVLKRISDALRDGDRILALLRGSAMNQDGHTSGPTVPNGPAQQAVIRRALENAGIAPREVSYIEAHGTGTSLGDPIEATALDAVFSTGRSSDCHLTAGSVKTNIGHLEGAAGIAGLIKVVLSLQHREIPRNLHFEQPSPHIAWDRICLRVPTETEPWTSESTRKAGVSSFGFSGTNVHVVLEEAPASEVAPACAGTQQLLTLSARTEPALRELASRFREHLTATADSFASIAYTAYTGRTHLEHRLALLAADNAEASVKLAAFLEGRQVKDLRTSYLPEGTEGVAGSTSPVDLFLNGVTVEWSRPHKKVALPTYPFQRRRYWFQEQQNENNFTYEVAWQRLPDRATRYFPTFSAQTHAVPETGLLTALESLGAAYAARALGVIQSQHRSIASRHRRLFDTLRQIPTSAEAPNPSAVLAAYPDAADEITLITRCGENLADILSGELDAVETLLSPGDRTLEKIYEDSIASRAANELVRDTLARAVAEVPPGCKLRILEVGAGTGGTAAHLLPVLDPTRTEYVFTDLSKAFLVRARDRFASYPYMRFELLDAETDPEPQGFAPGSFDVLVAANVLHATADLRASLSNLRRLLAPGGMLLLLEVVQPQIWLNVTFGLLEGWWRFRDSDLRTSHPLLDSAEWRRVISRCGFDNAVAMQPSEAGSLRQELMVARAAQSAQSAESWLIWAGALPDKPPSHILFVPPAAGGDPETAAADACTQLIDLAQTLLGKQWPTKIWVAVRGSVPPSDTVPATLRGLGRVIGLEHPELWGGHIHCPDPADTARLIREMHAHPGERELALSEDGVRVPRVVRKELPVGEDPRFVSDATYLITGGLGFLGLRLAEWMAARGMRHVVLTGRSGAGNPEASRTLETLRRCGVRVEVMRADVANRTDMEQVFERIGAKMPALRGIVHAAGHGRSLPMESITPADLAAEFRPKVGGAWLLHQLTRDLPLDFFICFSSASSVWGAKGQAHYAAANSYLDALAHHRRSLGLPALSVNWGLVTGGGMISPEYRNWLTRIGVQPLEPEDGFRSLFRAAHTDTPQVVVAQVDWKIFTEVYQVHERSSLLDHLASTPHAATPRSFRGMAAGDRRNALLQFVREEFCGTLGLSLIEGPDPRQGFFDAGMDSLLAIEFKNRLQTALEMPLASTLAFNYPNAAAVADYLDSRFAQIAPAAQPSTEPEARERVENEPIAMVGMACRFPGADNPEAFWQLLRNGVDAVREMPAWRWDTDAIYDPNPDAAGKSYVRDGGFLDEVRTFDAEFFGIAPREAVSLDPQQRLLLEVTWEALEDAAMPWAQLTGSLTGVFVGVTNNDYQRLLAPNGDLSQIGSYYLSGNPLNGAAGRISYTLGLRGPAMVVDTACSSSLVAVHLACQSLRNRECDSAIAGGVNLILTPETTIGACRAHMLAPDGRCKAFDASADGFGRGEGCGAVVLRRLSDAQRDGDRILAVIRGSAVNQDGASSGFTVPSGPAQESLIRLALERSGVKPEEVGYVEAHGTGTTLGDPIEMGALGAVFGDRKEPLWTASVKSNIGHLESAAGIAALIKVALVLTHREIPPHVHFRTPSPHIAWDILPVRVPTNRTPWSAHGPRIAGISAFGASGTNAHLVIEEPPQIAAAAADLQQPHLFTLSAKTEAALRELAGRYSRHLTGRDALGDVCFTANTGRATHPYRLSVTVETISALRQALECVAAGSAASGVEIRKVDRASEPEPDWSDYYQGQKHRRVALPVYPFQREMHWPECATSRQELLYELEWHPQPLPEEAALDLSSPATVMTDLEAEAQGLAPSAPSFENLGETLERLSGAYAHHAVLEIAQGRLLTGSLWFEEELCLDLGVATRHRRLFRRLLEILGEDGYLKRDGAQWEIQPAFGQRTEQAPIESLLERNPAAAAELTMLHRCGTHLTGVLRGTCDPVSLLFPPNERITAATLYQRSSGAQVMNHLLGSAVRSLIKSIDPGRPLRVLETGGGVGSATVEILTALKGRNARYVFTDVSPWFTTQARETLRDYPFVEFSLLDIAGDPEQQGFRASDFDLIIAANVLHVVPDLRMAVGRLKKLLKAGGSLLLLEATEPRRWTDLIFGLTAGWCQYEDHDVRPSHVLVPAEGWRHLLRDCGLESSAFIPSRDDVSVLSQQAIVCAQTEAAATTNRSFANQTWIVLADTQGMAVTAVDAIRNGGGNCIVVDACEGYDDRGHYDRLLREIAIDPSGILHFRSLDKQVTPGPASIRHSCGSALHLVQAVLERGYASPPAVWLVTRQTGLDALAQAPLWGLGKVIAREQPELRCRLVDLDRIPSPDPLIREMVASHANEPEVAYRDGERYVRRLRRSARQQAPAPSLASNGTYLITGGTGGIGLWMASWLVARGARSIALVGRRPPSPAAAVRIAELRRKANVTLATADVSHREELAAVLAQQAPLRGVVHAAGTFDDRVVTEHRWELFEKVFAAKIHGAWNLHELTQHSGLDLFLLMSSASTVLGGSGMANYVAANTFLDALAHYRRSIGQPAVSVNWGLWSGVGMAVAAGSSRDRQWAQQGMRKIEPEAALSALDALLASGRAQGGILSVDWTRFLGQFPGGCIPNLFEDFAHREGPQEQPARLLEQLAGKPPGSQRELLRAHIRGEVASVLGLARSGSIDDRQGFFEMGMDSLTSMELRNRLQNAMKASIAATIAFKHPTVESLSEYLMEEVLHVRAGAERVGVSLEPNGTAFDKYSLADLEALLDQRLEALE